MTPNVAPQAFEIATRPAVGIFWLIRSTLVIDRSILAEGEPYGECITHAAGHYQRWLQWQSWDAAKLLAAGLPTLILDTEYEAWPRGRIVYEVPKGQFIIYADRRLQKPDMIGALKNAFALDQTNVIVRSDAHYL